MTIELSVCQMRQIKTVVDRWIFSAIFNACVASSGYWWAPKTSASLESISFSTLVAGIKRSSEILAAAWSRRENSSLMLFFYISTGVSIGPSKPRCKYMKPWARPEDIGIPWIVNLELMSDIMSSFAYNQLWLDDQYRWAMTKPMRR